MASVAVRSGTAALGSCSFQSGAQCRTAGAAGFAALPVRKQDLLHSNFQGKQLSFR